MGPFDHIQKKGSVAIKPQPAQIRKEVVSKLVSVRTPQRDLSSAKAKLSGPISSSIKGRRKTTTKRPPKLQQRLESESENDDDGIHSDADGAPKKRQKMDVDVKPDLCRQMRNEKSFLRDSYGIPTMVHAADIATVRNSTKYRPAFSSTPQFKQVDLQYPSACAVEK